MDLLKIWKNNKIPFQNVRLIHTPVMVKEVLSYLSPYKNNLFIDMTFGSGGHTKALLKAVPSLRVICLDRDPSAYSNSVELSKEFPNQIIPCLGRFSELPQILNNLNINKNSVDGILFDFGCSSDQLDIAKRGFSLSKSGPLDMRMDGNRFPDQPTALDVLLKADEHDLYKIFKIYGEEKLAKKVARAIVESRYSFREIKTTHDLAAIVEHISSSDHRLDKLQRPSHVATKIFQALRIFVNNELNEINYGMVLADWYLKLNGRIVTISFHSLEDRIVKRHLTGSHDTDAGEVSLKYVSYSKCFDKTDINEIKQTNWLLTTKHVVLPSKAEVDSNPRSRSAKLRAAIKIK
ncbi:probable methyltransferase-like protein 15 homolog [Halyomorpha halys]|uniref:probable methyltransferase-like protein 15 homolog n=1 Tax=Halyomorpha halys TaxID=286706 RepID=UPI0006D51BB6|nr:probable methyltransferase-like protein 15 homolog [Halyomorpha halys]XP_014284605.1 probable methyltransferase-like protein 15 homolog [Halyomorpha halys]